MCSIEGKKKLKLASQKQSEHTERRVEPLWSLPAEADSFPCDSLDHWGAVRGVRNDVWFQINKYIIIHTTTLELLYSHVKLSVRLYL